MARCALISLVAILGWSLFLSTAAAPGDYAVQRHTMKIVGPNEIPEPTPEELNTILRAVEQEESAERETKPLTYSELFKLLALWQISNEQIFYRVATEPPAQSVDLFETYVADNE